MDVAEPDVARILHANRVGKWLIAAHHPVGVQIGDGDILGPVDFERAGGGALFALAFGLQRVEFPVGYLIELDLGADVMLARQ